MPLAGIHFLARLRIGKRRGGALQFVDDPIAYFRGDGAAMHALSPAEAEPMQQQALAYRLSQLLPVIPPLAALADAQGLSADIALDDAPQLFFPHSIYKSYDPVWLHRSDFQRMGRWMQSFTTVNLAPDAAPAFSTVDAWLDWLEHDRGLDDRAPVTDRPLAR